jgi:predicted metalloprotease
MRKTADMWNAYLGLEGDDVIDAADAAQMMTMVKIARHATGETDRDNFVDGAGYQRVAAEVEGVSEE